MQRGALGVVCVLVIAVYACTPHLGMLESLSQNAADTYYNSLVQGFRAGQLNVKREVPPGLAQLPNPYDPAANRPYVWIDQHPLFDMSYYKGKLYLYWGVTPVLVLFWPYVALTGHYLPDKDAVVIFCTVGFLASVGLLRALWRRYFAEVSIGVVAACVLALGLASGVPVLLSRAEVYEVPISCGYMLTMFALGAIWCALHEPERRCRWLAAASVAYGLAVGARPSLLFGAVILLVPVAQAWRERRRIWALLMAATGPILLIGLGLMLYNALRFDNPFEFGLHYQLSAVQLVTQRFFSLHYLWFNFRIYFLEPARWSGHFPFVHEIAVPPLPAGHVRVETPIGVLSNIPLTWLALAAPLAWRGWSAQESSSLRWFVTAVALLFGICALSICLFSAVCIRYEVEFLPALLLLAVVGILGLERALATPGAWLAGRAVRWGWSLLLGFSVAFNWFASVEHSAEAHCNLGMVLWREGRYEEATKHFEQALRIKPNSSEAHCNLGMVLWREDRYEEAVGHFEQALRVRPDNAEAHNNLGGALLRLGKLQAAIGHFEQALRLQPGDADMQNNLGAALRQADRIQEAIGHFEQALRLQPDSAEAHNNLGLALAQQGRFQDAIGHFEQALRLKPDYAKAHNNLGLALQETGKTREAIRHFEQALRLQPDYAKAHSNMGFGLMRLGKMQEAIGHLEQALRLKPDDAAAHYNLGNAFLVLGKTRDAIEHYQQALRIQPDYAEAQNSLAWVLATITPAEGGDPVRAVTLAERACELTGHRVPAYLDTLAAAYAAAGRFDEAIATAQKALEPARAAGQTQLVREIEARMELYRGGHAYRVPVDGPGSRNP